MKKFLILMIAVMLITSCGMADSSEGDFAWHRFNNKTIQECDPYTFNTEKAHELGLAGGKNIADFTDEYFALQAYYGGMLWGWLCSKTALDEKDEKLINSGMELIERLEYRNIYQEKQSYATTFIYNRTNLMIENLEKDEIEELRDLYASKEIESEAATAFVEKTWLRVITENMDYPADTRCIHSMSNGRIVLNCSLIIGIDHACDYDENGMIKDYEKETEKDKFLAAFARDLEEEMNEILEVPVVVIIHD